MLLKKFLWKLLCKISETETRGILPVFKVKEVSVPCTKRGGATKAGYGDGTAEAPVIDNFKFVGIVGWDNPNPLTYNAVPPLSSTSVGGLVPCGIYPDGNSIKIQTQQHISNATINVYCLYINNLYII